MAARNHREMRAQIAEEAARLILENGESDYGVAKRKAAQRLGVFEERVLPNGSEIDEAILARQSLFGSDCSEEWRERVVAVALELMEQFSVYDARLAGGLAAGVLTSSTAVELHLFSDDAKSIAIDLLNRSVRYQSVDREVGIKGDRVPGFDYDWKGVPVELSVYSPRSVRGSITDATGRKGTKRLVLKEAEARLKSL